MNQNTLWYWSFLLSGFVAGCAWTEGSWLLALIAVIPLAAGFACTPIDDPHPPEYVRVREENRRLEALNRALRRMHNW